MRFIFYTHSLVSDWNHGNAHFLRGVMRDLKRRGHEVLALEPVDSWSRRNLISDKGLKVVARFKDTFPDLDYRIYGDNFDHEAAIEGADVVIVHEWTPPTLVERLGKARNAGGSFTLLFHDTHHRAISAEKDMAEMRLAHYDGVLAFGETLRERYLSAGWGEQVFTWHEAADDSLFKPMPDVEKTGNLIWVGNWGDDERTEELKTFLVRPARRLRLGGVVHGVRYPWRARWALRRAGLRYCGWIANADVPAAFARHRLTVHVPRRPYTKALPGIPTIRVFEALACGIPLISAPWEDAEGLFRPGQDFLFARSGREMQALMRKVLSDEAFAASLSLSGLESIKSRHTCRHRVDELLAILAAHGTCRVTEKLSNREAAQ